MKLSPIVLAIAVLGMTGSLQAAKASRKHSHRTQKAKPAKTAKAAEATTHKVKRGETAAKVASQHDLTVSELASLNPRVNMRRLSVGTVLHVAGPKKAAPAKVAPAPKIASRKSHSLMEAAAELPETPRISPAGLAHMERMLPSQVTRAIPEAQNIPSSGIPVGEIRTVLPKELTPQNTQLSASSFEPVDPEKLDLLWPVETRTVSSLFGPRTRTRKVAKVTKVRGRSRSLRKRMVSVRYSGRHQGVDLSAPTGTDIYAAMDGQVVSAGFHRQYGNFVVIDHGNGVSTLYAHNSANFAQEGDIVHRGQKIAVVGATGRATGPHLHFEVRLNGTHRDPLPYLNEDEEISLEMMAKNQAITAEH
jgi:murein DD-endopeptidase MepM/ murein hydrolase activator NlpD